MFAPVVIVIKMKNWELPIDIPFSYHVILPHRRDNYTPLDRRTKVYITWLRRFQLALRILQLIAGIGVLVLFSLFTGVDNTISWAMRILVCLSCIKYNLHLCQCNT